MVLEKRSGRLQIPIERSIRLRSVFVALVFIEHSIELYELKSTNVVVISPFSKIPCSGIFKKQIFLKGMDKYDGRE